MTAGVPAPSVASSVPIHWSVVSATLSPSEVCQTVVAASEPRLPTIRTVVLMVLPVAFWKTSRVREILAARVGHRDLAMDD